MTDPEEPPPGALRVWLLAPDGTPTGESWWDRSLRLHARFTVRYETMVELSRREPRVEFTLHGGTPGTWQRIGGHLRDPRPSWPPAAMHPVAFAAWAHLGETAGWLHVLLARADVDDLGPRPPEGGRPAWLWVSRPNPKWPGDEKARSAGMVWRRGQITPPDDAPVYDPVDLRSSVEAS